MSSEGNVPFAVQETLNSTAVNGASGNDINSISSASQQTLDSVHELPPKLVKEILSGEFMELFKLLPKNFNFVYDVKFCQKAAANKFIKWSTIDSQLWLKTFTVAPSLMKEELGFFQSGPSSMPSTVRGNEYCTCHNFNKGFSCARTPCPYTHRCNTSQVVEGVTLGSGALSPLNKESSHPHELGSPTVST